MKRLVGGGNFANLHWPYLWVSFFTLWKSFKWIFEQGLDLWTWVNQRAIDSTDPTPPSEAITGASLITPNTVEVQTLAREQLNRVKRRQEERSKHGSL